LFPYASAVLAACLFSGCVTEGIVPAGRAELKERFSEGSFQSSGGVVLKARLFAPEVPAGAKVPLVVYLHGAGQNGDDNERQLDGGVGCLYSFQRGRPDYAAYLLAPQCPAGSFWRDPEVLETLEELVESAASWPGVDPDRVYVTGFSMGGDASWKLVLARPDLFAAAVPVCGGPLASMEPDVPDVPAGLSDVAVWAFNAFDDGVVRPAFSKRVFAELWSRGDPSERHNFTETVSGGHDAGPVYGDRDVWIWMMSASRKEGR